MVNIIEKKLDIENEALKRFEMIGKFISCKPKIITGSIRSIDKTNISYIEPHRIIYNETTFLFFNFTNEVYIEDKNNKLIKEIKDLKYKNEDLEESHHLLKGILNKRKDEHLDLVTYLTKQVNSKDSNISHNFKKITNDLYKRNLISSSERKVIFNPPNLFTKSEINKALSSINKEMDESAKKYYQINQNENDYSI